MFLCKESEIWKINFYHQIPENPDTYSEPCQTSMTKR